MSQAPSKSLQLAPIPKTPGQPLIKYHVDTKSHELKAGFQHEVEAESVEAALKACVRDLLIAYTESSHCGQHRKITVTVWEQGKLHGSWLLDLVNPCPVPCGTCGGEGGVDSGGSTPWGAPIDLPCPDCGPKITNPFTDPPTNTATMEKT